MRGPDDPRIQPHGSPDAVVGGGGGIVPHDEVVAFFVLHLVSRDGGGEGEDAEVGEAADYAALAEDDLAAG